ncbi:hypothetical protein P3W45_001496 [Vairimorpha bombi]|jgi:Ca2+-dependent lipid-binding protein
MQEESKIPDKSKLSKPLNPLDIPVRHRKAIPHQYKKATQDYRSSLDIDPKEGFFFYLRIPSLIFFGVFGGYIVGRFNLNIFYILFVSYTVYFVYNRKIRKFTNSLKSLINDRTRREKSKYSGESVEWINYIVEKFWDVAEPIISNDVYQNVNRELLKICPPFLNELKLTEFTLGSRPPFIDKITYHSSKDNSVTVDINVGFVPLEASKDAVDYFLGEKKKWNSKIILHARLGTRNSLGINLPIMVKEFYFTGRLRATINLIPKNNFIKDVEVCLMEVPDFDFTLVPLKTVDLMDIPGLSTWIKKTIVSAMSKEIINPSSIVIDVDKIAQSKGYNIGVACIQILSLENDEDEKLVGEVDIDGRPEFQTSSRAGKNLVFNEYFYTIIQNIDEKIGITFFGDKNSVKSSGSLFLRNVHLEEPEEDLETDIKIDKKTIKILPQRKIKPRRSVFNKIRLTKNEQTYAYLNTNFVYYPIQKKKTNSAIVTMKLIGAENMLSINDDKGEIYSSFCTVIVSPLNKNQNSVPLEYIQNTSSAAAMVVSGVLKTEEDEINSIQTGTDSTTLKLLPPSSSTFYIFESKRVFNNNSPNYNEVFQFFARDLSVDVVSVCIMNDKNSEIIGRVRLDLNDIVDGKPLKYKLRDARCGKMELQFDLNYIDLEEKDEQIVKYTSVQKITVETVSENGIFYGVVETNTDSFAMDPFTSELPIKKNIFVPVHDDDILKFKLFKETVNGDVFLGEEEVPINYTEESKRVALILNDNISVTLRTEGEYLEDFTGTPSKKDTLKIIQVKLGKFYGLNEEVFVEFRNQDGIVKASAFSRDRQINNVFTILAGKEEICAIIKNGDQGENRILGKCTIPKRFADEKMTLNEFGLAVDLQADIQTCTYSAPSNLKKGFLEVYIKSAKNLKSSESGRVNAFVKILVNDNKVFKTKPAPETNDPIFYESFVMSVDKLRDLFTIQVYDNNSSSKNSLLSFIEFPLHNINEGFSEIEFKLTDSKTFKKMGSTIRLGFNFCRDASTLKVKKRGILGDFFGF